MIRTALAHWRNSNALVRFIHFKFVDSNTKRSEFLHFIRLFGIGQVSDRSEARTLCRFVVPLYHFVRLTNKNRNKIINVLSLVRARAIARVVVTNYNMWYSDATIKSLVIVLCELRTLVVREVVYA